MNLTVRQKLSVMMFLQYAIWGAWAVSMGGFMGETLDFTGLQIGSIYSTTAIAAIISPLFMGFIADRFLATEKMIALLHLIGAGLLAAAAITKDFQQLYVIMIVYSICYMPTLALTNSISFANIGDPEKEFPGIRVWGTWGWIVAGWAVGFWLDIPRGTSNAPIFLAAGASVALGLFALSLPHTPPRGKNESAAESSEKGESIFKLLTGDVSFLVFVVCSFLVCIPLSFYYAFANVFLTEIDAPVPTALQTLGQLSEVGFMAAMPFFIVRLGVKRMLAVGMLAWTIRYLCFGTLAMPAVVFGLFLHGICYDFFFVASQIYVDTRVKESQRASAQSFIAFVTMGIGMFIGAYVGGWTFDRYPPAIQVDIETVADGKSDDSTSVLPAWDPEGKKGFAAEFNLDKDGTISADDITSDYEETNDGTGTKTIYKQTSLAAAIKAADTDEDGKTTRTEWRAAKQHVWYYIWLWPALAAAGTCLLFWFGFRDTRSKGVEAVMAEEAPLGAGDEPEPQVG
jgi:nucleoside transporter